MMRHLTRAEEVALIAAVQSGDNAAAEELLAANSGLVAAIALKYLPYAGSHEIDDLIQFGRLGLLEAIRRFDPARGTRLSTVATSWARQAISRGCSSGQMVRTPDHWRWERDDAPADALGADFCNEAAPRSPSAPEAAEIEPREARRDPERGGRRAVEVLSLDAMLLGGETRAIDAIRDPRDLEEDVIARDLAERAIAALDQLTGIERITLRQLYGLDGDGAWSAQAVARGAGVSGTTVRRRERRAIEKLRLAMGADL